MHNFIYIDGEMVPSLDPMLRAEIVAANFVEPFDESSVKGLKEYNKALKDEEKIAADKAAKDQANFETIAAARAAHQARVDGLDETIEKEYSSLVWNPETGMICSLAMAWNDHKPVAFHGHDGLVWDQAMSMGAEREILTGFFKTYVAMCKHAGSQPTIVGHNIRSFDHPYIVKRALICGVKIPDVFPRHGDPSWKSNVKDTMEMWTGKQSRFGDKDSFISQDKLCKLRGASGKGDMDGSGVLALFRAGKHAEIGSYNIKDVRDLRDNHKWWLQVDKLVDPRAATAGFTKPILDDEIPH